MRSYEIILARHGRPLMNGVSPITGAELGAWVRRYNECGIDRDLPPPDALRQLAAAAGCILTSNLPRSIESGVALTDNSQIEPDLREAGLPDRISIPIRLHPGICVALARMSWWMNWSTSAETIADARERATRATERLCALASEHGSVLVVGHGMFNRFIAKRLRKRGWRGPGVLPHGYWSAARFVQNL
jgi:broad specificity phosphatase PhoE